MKKLVVAILVVAFMSWGVNLSWSSTQYQKLENTALPNLNSNNDNIAVEISDLNADSKDDLIIGKFGIVQNEANLNDPANKKYLEIWIWDDTQAKFVDETSIWTRYLVDNSPGPEEKVFGHKVPIMDIAVGFINGIKVIAICTEYEGIFVYKINEADKCLQDLNFTTTYQPIGDSMGMSLEILDGKLIVGVFSFYETVVIYSYSNSSWTPTSIASSNPWGINTFAPSDIKGAKDITTNKTILGVAALDVSWGWGMKNAVYTLDDGNEYRVYTPAELGDCYSVAISFTGGEKIHWGTVSSNEYDVYYRDIEDSLYLFYGYYGYANKIENVTNPSEPVNSLLDKPDTATGMNTDRIRATDQLIAWTYHPNSSGVGIVVYRASSTPSPYFADMYGNKKNEFDLFTPIPEITIESPTNDTIIRVDPDNPATLIIKGEVTDCVQYVSHISIELYQRNSDPPLVTAIPNIVNKPQEPNSTVFRTAFEAKITLTSDLVNMGGNSYGIRVRAINALIEPSTQIINMVSRPTFEEKAGELYDIIFRPEAEFEDGTYDADLTANASPNNTRSNKTPSDYDNRIEEMKKASFLYNKIMRHKTLSFDIIENHEGRLEPSYENKHMVKWVFNKAEEIPGYNGKIPETIKVFLKKNKPMYCEGLIATEMVLYKKNTGANTPIEYESDTYVAVSLRDGWNGAVVNVEGQLIAEYSAINIIPFVDWTTPVFSTNQMQSANSGILYRRSVETRQNRLQNKNELNPIDKQIDFRGGSGNPQDAIQRAQVSLFDDHFDVNGVLARDFATFDPASFFVFYTAPDSKNNPDAFLATISTVDSKGNEIDKIANFTMRRQDVRKNTYISKQRFVLVSTDLDDQFETKLDSNAPFAPDGSPDDCTLNIFKWPDITANPQKVIMGGKVKVVFKWGDQAKTQEIGIGDEKPLMLDVQGNLFKDCEIDAQSMLQNYAYANTAFAAANIQVKIPDQIAQLDAKKYKIDLSDGFDLGSSNEEIFNSLTADYTLTSDEYALLKIAPINQYQIHFYAVNFLKKTEKNKYKVLNTTYGDYNRYFYEKKKVADIVTDRPVVVTQKDQLGINAKRVRFNLSHELGHILMRMRIHDNSFFAKFLATKGIIKIHPLQFGGKLFVFNSSEMQIPFDGSVTTNFKSSDTPEYTFSGTLYASNNKITTLQDFVLVCGGLKINGKPAPLNKNTGKPWGHQTFNFTIENVNPLLRNLRDKKLMEIYESDLDKYNASNNPIRLIGINEVLRSGAKKYVRP